MPTLPDYTPSTDYSLDGKGGSANSANTGKSTKRTGTNFVYYRIYTELGAIESNNPIYSNDRFIGHLPLKSLAPPRTAATVKRYICKCEGLLDPEKSLLFVPLSSPRPKEDSARLPLYSPFEPGLSEQDPIALVVDSEKRSTNVKLLEGLPERSDDKADIRYVHYRVYSSEGDERSKTAFDESDGSLGRINTLFVAPPHTAGSLKACIAKTEGLVTPNHTLYKDMRLFKNLGSDVAMSDADGLSFLGATYPGRNEGDPVALVNASDNISVDKERTPVFQGNSPAYINEPQAGANPTSGSDSTFTKRARLTYTYGYARITPGWLSITKGDVVLTDGILVSRTSPHVSKKSYSGYIAIDSLGNKGFVLAQYLIFI